MKDTIIELNDVTKDYKEHRGNFHINLQLEEGETLGLVGENGAGKTTLLRQIMGFVNSDSGSIHIYDLDAYKDSSLTKNYIGYIPGEINFPDVKTGNEFLRQYAATLGLKEENFKRADEVIKRMQLDVTAYPRRMSKGMKQKMAIVTSLMKEAPILLFDEPTTGLDPLMREEFLSLVLEEKEKGTSIIMSSNTIEELEKVADKVALISSGEIVDIADCKEVYGSKKRDYKIEFETEEDYLSYLAIAKEVTIRTQEKYHQLTIRIDKNDVKKYMEPLENKRIKFISQIPYTLQTYFDEQMKLRGKQK